MNKHPKIRALEKNILKYRAFQMMLLLHHVESLKMFVVNSIRATDKIIGHKNTERLPEGTKKLFKKVWAILVKENILTQEESDDLQNIIDIRNKIGHAIHDMVSDISAPHTLLPPKSPYDYLAIERLEKYRKKIGEGIRSKYIMSLGFRELAFEEAELTYKEELSRLKNKIDRQYKERKKWNRLTHMSRPPVNRQ